MSSDDKFYFRLYVAGQGPNSIQAIANLRSLCREHLPGRHKIHILDILRYPNRALNDHVLLTPTLVKLLPRPIGRVVGNLSDTKTVMLACGLEFARE